MIIYIYIYIISRVCWLQRLMHCITKLAAWCDSRETVLYIYCNHLYSGSVIDEVDNTRVYCVGEFLCSSNENVVKICVLMPILLLKTIFRLDILGKVNWIQVSVPLMNVYIAEIRLQKITASHRLNQRSNTSYTDGWATVLQLVRSGHNSRLGDDRTYRPCVATMFHHHSAKFLSASKRSCPLFIQHALYSM